MNNLETALRAAARPTERVALITFDILAGEAAESVDIDQDGFPGYVLTALIDLDRLWNGWEIPRIPRAELERLAGDPDALAAMLIESIEFEPNTGAVRLAYQGLLESILPDSDGLYAFASGWTWTRVPA